MGDETLADGISVAAPFICAVVFAFHFFPWYFGRSFKKGSKNDEDVHIRGEIKQLLKQASSLSQVEYDPLLSFLVRLWYLSSICVIGYGVSSSLPVCFYHRKPSTFAQAAKLRRLAASKEKELMKKQESVGQDIKDSHDSQQRLLFIIKVITYFILVCWFWRIPVTSISRHLVQPFGKLLSWGTGSPLSDHVTVGIIPWLVLCTRVSKLVFRHFK